MTRSIPFCRHTAPRNRAGGLAVTLCLLLLLAPLPGPASAADDGETIEQANDTIKEIAKARKQKDVDALGAALVRAVELHNGLEGESMRRKLLAAVGSVLKGKRSAALVGEALSTLEQMDDGDGVLKQLKPVLPSPSAVTVDDNGLYAVQIVGSVRAPKGIKLLSDLGFKAKNLKVRIEAVRALGKYRELEQGRVKALEKLLALLVKLGPVEGRDPTEAALVLWRAMEGPIVGALDELTFKELKTTAAWLAWQADHKGKLKRAFDD